MLTRENVEKVAVLARLEFSDAEVDQFTAQLGDIVTFIEQLSEVDTEGVLEMAHPLDVHCVTRPDELRAGLTHEQALANSPSHDDDCFRVPAVMNK